MADPLLISTDRGLYCAAADFYIDAWAPVPRNIITHAHSDHARPGSDRYLVADEGLAPLRHRLGSHSRIQTSRYGSVVQIHDVKVSFHPAGHVLGSSQIRIERGGEIWVVSGDYKRQPDPTCLPFEPIACHTFMTESTFGLPIFRWRPPEVEMSEINAWWRANREHRVTSILFAYTLGKAQRVLAGLIGQSAPILLHGAMLGMVEVYRSAGVTFPATVHASAEALRAAGGTALVLAPPSAAHSSWMRKFAPLSTGMASGWMRVRAFQRRREVDRGFVLSDHVDWPGLLQTVRETGANRIGVTHGYANVVTRCLNETGLESFVVPSRFTGEEQEALPEPAEPQDPMLLTSGAGT